MSTLKIAPFYTNIWYKELDISLDSSIKACYDIESTNPSTRISNTTNGYHSPVFDQQDFQKYFADLAPVLEEVIQNVSQDVNKQLTIAKFWVNINRKYAYNKNHNHPGALLSSVLYLKTNETAGDIVFENPFEMTGFPAFQGSYRVKPKNGLLLVFPAYLRHDVEQNLSDEDRISIAINFWSTQ